MSVMLYGCESWTLDKGSKALSSLRKTHHGMVRRMCHFSMRNHHNNLHVTVMDLRSRLNLVPIENYIHNRQLLQFGRFVRKEPDKLPRMFLSVYGSVGGIRTSKASSYVKYIINLLHDRVINPPQAAGGNANDNAVEDENGEGDGIVADWYEAAQDKGLWKELCKSRVLYGKPPE